MHGVAQPTCGEHMIAWPPLYSQPAHASADGAKPLLAAVSVVTSMASSLAGPVLIQQWSSDTCQTGKNASIFESKKFCYDPSPWILVVSILPSHQHLLCQRYNLKVSQAASLILVVWGLAPY